MRILEFREVDIDKLTPSEENVRKIELTKLTLRGLANSIKRYGLVNPIIITEDNKIVIGKRRWRAFKLLWEKTGKEKFKKIPCLIAEFEPRFENDPRNEMIIASAIENMTKKMLTQDEEAEAIHAFNMKGLTKTEISHITGNPKWLVDIFLKREYLHDWNLKFKDEKKNKEITLVASSVSSDSVKKLGEAIGKRRNLKLIGWQEIQEEEGS